MKKMLFMHQEDIDILVFFFFLYRKTNEFRLTKCIYSPIKIFWQDSWKIVDKLVCCRTNNINKIEKWSKCQRDVLKRKIVSIRNPLNGMILYYN